MKKMIRVLLVKLMLLTVLFGLMGCTQRDTLVISTTTSLYDTGLWNELEDRFEQANNIRLDIIYAGTGITMEYGRRGDVDVMVVHDRSREETFIAEGYGIERIPFAYNYFVIAGPADDPAGIKGLAPEAAFQKLFQAKNVSFISRGDESGTHAKEKAIWRAAGLDYETVRTSGQWYVETGRGMGPTLLMAREFQGYTLSDIGTFLAFKGDTGLEPIVDRGSILLNVYSVIVINPENVTGVKADLGQILADFLVSDEIQRVIGEYGVKDYGAPLFYPCAGNEPTQ